MLLACASIFDGKEEGKMEVENARTIGASPVVKEIIESERKT